MKILILLLMMILMLLSRSTRPQTITWQKEYTGPGYLDGTSVTQIFDEGYVMCGLNLGKFYVVRVNKYGDTIWTRNFPGIWPTKVIQTKDSNFVICGDILDSSGFPGNSYLLKINRNSTIMWTKQFGAALDNNFRDVYETSNGNLSMIGTQTVSLLPPIRYNMFFAQTDQNGNTLQIREYDSTGTGLTIDEIYGKGFLLSGTSTLVTDYSGNVLEEHRNFGSRGALLSIEKDGYIFRYRTDTSSLTGVKIVKTDTALKLVWTKTLTQSQRSIYGNDFIKTQDSYVIGGQSVNFQGYSYGYLAKISSSGNLIWEKEYPRKNYYVDFSSVFYCKDNGLIGFGSTESESEGVAKFLATKTDSNGNTTLISINNNFQASVEDFKLFQNFPNPFNGSTVLKYYLSHNSLVSIVVYNSIGEIVDEILFEHKPAGSYEIKYNMQKAGSGIYFCRINIWRDEFNVSNTIKLCLLK